MGSVHHQFGNKRGLFTVPSGPAVDALPSDAMTEAALWIATHPARESAQNR